MNRTTSLIIGMSLIIFGGLVLAANLILPLAGWGIGWVARMAWPFLIVGAGIVFVVPALLARRPSGLGGLFIPGVPVLATGVILLFANTFNQWGAWEILWPVEVLAVAAAFLLAAWKLSVIWLLIPAMIIGLNGIVLQFCALTGWWEAWAVLWTVEPLSLGLAFLIIGAAKRLPGMVFAGMLFSAFAGVAFLGMGLVMIGGWTIVRVGWPMLLILLGASLLVLAIIRRPSAALR
jgi:hypothetical protein